MARFEEVAMPPALTAEHDAARDTLESLAAFAGLERTTVVSRLAQETAAMRLHGVETLFPRWIRRPLDAMRLFEDVHRRVAISLYEVRKELKLVEKKLVGARAGGSKGAAATLSHQAAALPGGAPPQGRGEGLGRAGRDPPRAARLVQPHVLVLEGQALDPPGGPGQPVCDLARFLHRLLERGPVGAVLLTG